AHRDWPSGRSASPVQNRAARLLPALMDETLCRFESIFHEAGANRIAIMIDPSKRALDVWPNRLCEGTVARAPVICSGEHNKKRRGIDAAVVPLKRNLSQRGHFVRAHLVYHLAGLRVLLRVLRLGLGSCQVRQDATCDRRTKPEALESSDDSVPAEYRAEPRNTSVRIRA